MRLRCRRGRSGRASAHAERGTMRGLTFRLLGLMAVAAAVGFSTAAKGDQLTGCCSCGPLKCVDTTVENCPSSRSDDWGCTFTLSGHCSDDYCVGGTQTASPDVSHTPTKTPSKTGTKTPTKTATKTHHPSVTATATCSASPGHGGSPTSTPTASATVSPTGTATTTAAPTPSDTPEPTATAS